ncbi:MAG: hypothetical protein ABIB43_01405 [archaeon]
MKKNVFLIMAIFGILVASLVSADVIPGNSHPLSKCVEIVNLNEFSDIYLIGYITGPMVENYETYIIEPDKCLTMGYKFNTLKILAAEKSYVDSVGIENINPFSKVLIKDIRLNKDLNCYYDASNNLSPCLDSIEGWYEEELSDEKFYTSEIEISPYGGYVDEDNPLIKLEIEYSIAGFSDDKLVLYKSKETSKYNNGQSDKVEVFDKPTTNNQEPINSEPNPEPTPESQGFWSKVGCFFKKLFSGSC